MGRYARKKQHKGDKAITSKFKTKRRVKDHDQIHMDLKPEEAKRLLNQEVDLDRPGNAQFYCIYCAYVNDFLYFALIALNQTLHAVFRIIETVAELQKNGPKLDIIFSIVRLVYCTTGRG